MSRLVIVTGEVKRKRAVAKASPNRANQLAGIDAVSYTHLDVYKRQDVKSSWPLCPGLHTCYNGGDSGKPGREAEPISKSRLSSDCTLQLGCMKVESLVIADQHAAVNTFPGLVHTARHTMGVGLTLSWCANRKGAANHGRVSDWGEVVTR